MLIKIVYNVVLIVFFLIIVSATLGLSITSVVIGAINLYSNCTGYSQIPEYLITTGVLGIVAFLVRFSNNLSNKKEKNTEQKEDDDSCFLQLIYFVHVGVVIWGSVILFGKDKPACDTVMFNYALSINLTTYALLTLYILFYCCTCFVVWCDSCTTEYDNHKDSSIKKQVPEVVIEIQNTNQTEV